jgi:hypothetical protein
MQSLQPKAGDILVLQARTISGFFPFAGISCRSFLMINLAQTNSHCVWFHPFAQSTLADKDTPLHQ